jgi:chromosome segregation ATPase
MHYKKPQLVSRLREAERTIQQLEQQLAHVTNEYLEQDACIVELKAKLTELEPYRTFVEQVRQRVRDEEHGGSTS